MYILKFEDITLKDKDSVGAKAFNLSSISDLGLNIPKGFCIKSNMFHHIIVSNEKLQNLIDNLTFLKDDNEGKITTYSEEIKEVIMSIDFEEAFVSQLGSTIEEFGKDTRFAIRSSAMNEDSIEKSFAGQYESYLNVQGIEEILEKVKECFASVFNFRSLIYKDSISYEDFRFSVLVQEMVDAEYSGVAFSADPVTSDRSSTIIEVVKGLGDNFVSGKKNAQRYLLFKENLVKGFNYKKELIDTDMIFEIGHTIKRISEKMNVPQDIEWCIKEKKLYVLQTRPITTLFPMPQKKDNNKRVYMSIGHLQVMTNAMKPLGISVFQLASQFELDVIGDRMYADISHDFTKRSGMKMIKQKVKNMDPLMTKYVESIFDNKKLLSELPKGEPNLLKGTSFVPWIKNAIILYITKDYNKIKETHKSFDESSLELESRLQRAAINEIPRTIMEDKEELSKIVYNDLMFGAILLNLYLSNWLDKSGLKLFNIPNITKKLSRSIENNVSTEVGLALGDIADSIRDNKEAKKYILSANTKCFIEGLKKINGSEEIIQRYEQFIEKYGFRCSGEIDITRDRWKENQEQLRTFIISNLKTLTKGEHYTYYNEGKAEVEEILNSLYQKNVKSRKVEKFILRAKLYRKFLGVREDPKYFWMKRFYIYKKSLLKLARYLQEIGAISTVEDIYYLTLEEIEKVLKENTSVNDYITSRRTEYKKNKKLSPPRIILSDGTVPYINNEDIINPSSLTGLAVSSGKIEGTVVVAETIESVDLTKGNILVTMFTDPSWTPFFTSIDGLITEIGGMMTHGAVITREYGIPAIVGVEGATKKLKTGDKIILDADTGRIEVIK